MRLADLKYDDHGLIATVVTDATTGRLLMLGYSSQESLRLTIHTGLMHFYSRSRQKLWLKGETSRHYHYVLNIRYDCDQDALEFQVRADGPTCHTGQVSCFYRDLLGDLDADELPPPTKPEEAPLPPTSR